SRCWTASATNRASPSSCSPWTKAPIRASWGRWPATIHASTWARRGGSTIRPRACGASASRPSARQASTTPSASTTTPAPSFPSPRATTSPAASTARCWRSWSPSTAWKRTRPPKSPWTWPTTCPSAPTGSEPRARPFRTLAPVAASHAMRRHIENRRSPMIRPRTALLAALALACGHASAAPGTLREAYRDGFLLGTAVNDAIVSGEDAAQQALAVRHFNAITLENSIKAEVLHPEPGRWDFERADAFVEFGGRHGMFVVGHTLVWHNQIPDWFFQDRDGRPADTATMRTRLRDYIHTVAGRYAGRVHAWDVVNEQIGEDGRYRDTTWVRAYGGDGDALMRDAFRFAAEAAPDAELYYNDFNAWRPEKVAGIVRMVGMLKAHGIRIDGVGIQGHWGLN